MESHSETRHAGALTIRRRLRHKNRLPKKLLTPKNSYPPPQCLHATQNRHPNPKSFVVAIEVG